MSRKQVVVPDFACMCFLEWEATGLEPTLVGLWRLVCPLGARPPWEPAGLGRAEEKPQFQQQYLTETSPRSAVCRT